MQANISLGEVLGATGLNVDPVDDQFSESDLVFDDMEVQILLKGIVPIISFSDDLENNLAKRWSRVVVIRLLGCKIGFLALQSRLQNLWKKASFKLLDLGNDFFLVNFSNQVDFQTAILEGPWVILGSYIQV